jgi:hypothetical protein
MPAGSVWGWIPVPARSRHSSRHYRRPCAPNPALSGRIRRGQPPMDETGDHLPRAPQGCRSDADPTPSARTYDLAPHSEGASAMLAKMQRVMAGHPEAEGVALRDLVSAMEGETFPVLILLFALLLVSPVSAVPGATTLLGLSIAAIMAQWVAGRSRAWLPAALLDRHLPAGRAMAALRRLQGPVRWVERRLRQRQDWVFSAPLAKVPKATVLMAALCAPLMEVIPGSGTSVGAAIALFAAGLLARDGLIVLVGASLAAILPVSLWLLLT